MDQNCQCSHFHWECQSRANPTIPDRWISNSTDVVFDITQFDTNEWLLQTHNSFINSRFGGWTVASKLNESISAPWIEGTETKLIAWFNNKAYHALPAFTNAIHNAMLRALNANAKAGISTFSHPLKLSTGQISSQTL